MAYSHHDPCLVFTPSLATVLQPVPVINPVCASLYSLAASVAPCVHVGLVLADCDRSGLLTQSFPDTHAD